MGIVMIARCDNCSREFDSDRDQRYGTALFREAMRKRGWLVDRNNFMLCEECRARHEGRVPVREESV